VLLYFIWQGSGWVMTMRYFLPIYPFLMMLAAWAISTLWDRVRALLAARGFGLRHPAALIAAGLGVFVVLAGVAWGFAVSRIYTRPHTRVAASRWIVENVPSDITLTIQTADGPREFQVGLPNDWPLRDPAASEDPTAPALQGTLLEAGMTRRVEFSVPFTGTLTAIRFHRIVPTSAGSTSAALDVALLPTGSMVTPLAQGRIEGITAAGSDPRGQPYTLSIAPPELVANRTYTLALTPDGQHTLVLSGASIAVEGTWDDPVPISIAPYSVWGGQYSPLAFEMAWEDIPEKRVRMQVVLDHADYITISSNRFYDSLRRNPERWPMTLAYYRALFSGNLGFELVGDFTSRPNLGPIEFRDDTAEEAWTVYDHPRVFVFRKTSAYDPAHTAAILNSVDLDSAVRAIAGDAKGRPVRLPLPDGGGPSGGSAAGLGGDASSYDPAPRDFFSRNQPLAVVIWWALIALIGWAAFPLLWVLLPGLPDRAYPLARTFGLLFAAWLAWLLASLKLLPWRGFTVLLALIALAVLSAAVIWPRRREFGAWLRAHRTGILLVELLAATLFVAFVLIRADNPDLWHPTFGGEKPMDLAYLNAVLRSDFFPPYDPWFQGGTINYYYFGFVIVGVPIKLLGMRVALAYNLMLPTLYALTGMGAFSAAYNLLARRATAAPAHPLPAVQGGGHGVGFPLHWPALTAGLGALILAVVLGSLDQIRTILWGLAELGSGAPAWAVTAFPPLDDTLKGLALKLNQDVLLPIGLGEWYWNATRVIPVPIDPATQYPTEIGPITEFPFFTFLYADLHAHMIALPITLFVIGWCVALVRGPGVDTPDVGRLRRWVEALLLGFIGALAVGSLRPTNTWDWPTYLALSAAALMIAHFRRRSSEAALPALGIGGLGAVLLGGLVFWAAISSSQSVSGTLVLAMTGLAALIGLIAGFALALGVMRAPAAEDPHDALHHWLTLLGGGMHVIALAAATALLFLPFIQNYQLGYDRVIPWTGSRTPLWAYFDILGIFLFVIATWLLWESRPFLRAVNRRNVIPALVVLALAIVFTRAAASSVTPVAALALPMLALALLHFLRREQPAAKRFVLIMLIGALALTLAVEVIVLQGDLSRMNTVFKFYMQVWVLLAVVAGAALGWLVPALRRIPEWLSLLWMAALALLVFLALLYTLLAVQAKIEDRWNPDAPQTLDGMDYMRYVVNYENGVAFSLAPDYAMLRWLQDNIKGTPVVVEGLSWREYLWGNRVSVYTGLPTVVGWNWHQRQQRPVFADEVWKRHSDVPLIYSVANIDWAMALLERYHVDLIVVGELERAYYPAVGLDKFRRMAAMGLLRVIYERDNTVIYEVVRE
jgi:YYY domain-containing protein